ncbi:MAG TPA: ABC transporter permease subunit [Bacteroidales bacterium]|nr:ABC transporter permease subunit [Bacteroidales bacterium]HPT11699.1 ABC transporter permease subunit [Bacteroidales bacterium]
MNLNLFLREMRRNAMSLLLWMAVVTLLISVTMSMYRTFIDNQSKVLGMMNLIPKSALQFKGVSNFNDLFSVLGFYAVNNVIYMMLLGSIYSIILSSNILLKEEYGKSADFLLSWPLTRSDVFISKMSVFVLNVFLLNLVATLAGFISIEIVKTGPFGIKPFLVLSLYTFLLNLLFGAIGLFISTLIRKPKSITTFSIGLVLIMYFIYTLSKITESASKLGYLSPFKYADMDAMKPGYGLEPWRVLFFIGLSILLLVSSFRIYKRKDIYL